MSGACNFSVSDQVFTSASFKKDLVLAKAADKSGEAVTKKHMVVNQHYSRFRNCHPVWV